MQDLKVIVMYETFVSFHFQEVDVPSDLPEIMGRKSTLQYHEMQSVLQVLCKKTPVVEIGGMYVVALHLSHLGFHVTYLGRIGDDELGKELAHKFSSSCVGSEIFTIPKSQTGILTILHCESDGPRYLAMRGANNFRVQAKGKLHSTEAYSLDIGFRNKDLIYLNGYSLCSENSEVWVDAVLERLRRPSTPSLMLDVGGAVAYGSLRPMLCELIGEASLLKLNRHEAYHLADTHTIDGQLGVLRSLLKDEESVCLLSLDRDGCVAFTKQTAVHVQVPTPNKINRVDGAGDVLFCRFAWNYLARELNIQDSLGDAVMGATRWVVQRTVEIDTLDTAKAILCVSRGI